MTTKPQPVAAWALHTPLDPEAVGVHLPALQAAGLLGIAEEHGRTVVYLPARVDGLPLTGEWRPVPKQDWLQEWKAGLEPVTIGVLRIAPPWAAVEGDVVIDIAQAFGTGHHETTAGCLAALQEQDVAGRRLLDVGTGSGILAICAARLGAHPVVAVDNDPLAVREAAANAERNRVQLDLRSGSLEAIGGGYDVVLANLDTDTISALAGDLGARLAPGGTLIAGGVSISRAGEAVRALEGAGVAVVARPGREWMVLIGRGLSTCG